MLGAGDVSGFGAPGRGDRVNPESDMIPIEFFKAEIATLTDVWF
jgi:hypothetical protein